MPRPRRLLNVPCDTHGEGPCPSPKGCANRRARAGLPPAQSGPTGGERRKRARLESGEADARVERTRRKLEAARAEVERLEKLLGEA